MIETFQVDNREPMVIHHSLETELQSVIPFVKLEIGDYRWKSPLGKVYIERKSVSDLLNSFKTGRASVQLRNLIDTADIPILLIEGRIGETWNGNIDTGKWGKGKGWTTGWDFVAIDHLLLSWQMAGVFLAHSSSLAKTPHRIASLYKWTQKEEHLSLARRKVISVKEDSPQVTTLATFPGIGHKRAREIIDQYSLRQLAAMDKKELAKVVGNVTAGKVMEHLGVV